MTTLENPFGNALFFDGEVTAVVKDPSGLHPDNIIQIEDAWEVQVDWDVSGLVSGLMGGEWRIAVHYESIGKGPEDEAGSATVPVTDALPGPFPNYERSYSHTIDVPAGLPEGAYRLVTLLKYRTPGGTPYEIAGFVEGPIFQVYKSN